MHFIVLLFLGYICLFLIPASIRNPKWFLAVWGILVVAISLAFLEHKRRDTTADPLAQMFDRALLDVSVFAVAMAFGAWALRRIAEKRGWCGYPHWFVLVLGCIAMPSALFFRFSQ